MKSLKKAVDDYADFHWGSLPENDLRKATEFLQSTVDMIKNDPQVSAENLGDIALVNEVGARFNSVVEISQLPPRSDDFEKACTNAIASNLKKYYPNLVHPAERIYPTQIGASAYGLNQEH